MKKETFEGPGQKQRAELKALKDLPDESIDTSDIPEILDWSGAKRGLLYRPIKKQITLRLDADVVSWFKASAPDGRGYQTEINRVLREHTGWALKQNSAREKVVEALARQGRLRQKPYRESAGKLAVCKGRNLDDKGTTEALARALLDKVSEDARRELNNVTWWTEAPQAARDELIARWEELLSQCFNIGLSVSSELEKWLAASDKSDHREIESNAEGGALSRSRNDH